MRQSDLYLYEREYPNWGILHDDSWVDDYDPLHYGARCLKKWPWIHAEPETASSKGTDLYIGLNRHDKEWYILLEDHNGVLRARMRVDSPREGYRGIAKYAPEDYSYIGYPIRGTITASVAEMDNLRFNLRALPNTKDLPKNRTLLKGKCLYDVIAQYPTTTVAYKCDVIAMRHPLASPDRPYILAFYHMYTDTLLLVSPTLTYDDVVHGFSVLTVPSHLRQEDPKVKPYTDTKAKNPYTVELGTPHNPPAWWASLNSHLTPVVKLKPIGTDYRHQIIDKMNCPVPIYVIKDDVRVRYECGMVLVRSNTGGPSECFGRDYKVEFRQGNLLIASLDLTVVLSEDENPWGWEALKKLQVEPPKAQLLGDHVFCKDVNKVLKEASLVPDIKFSEGTTYRCRFITCITKDGVETKHACDITFLNPRVTPDNKVMLSLGFVQDGKLLAVVPNVEDVDCLSNCISNHDPVSVIDRLLLAVDTLVTRLRSMTVLPRDPVFIELDGPATLEQTLSMYKATDYSNLSYDTAYFRQRPLPSITRTLTSTKNPQRPPVVLPEAARPSYSRVTRRCLGRGITTFDTLVVRGPAIPDCLSHISTVEVFCYEEANVCSLVLSDGGYVVYETEKTKDLLSLSHLFNKIVSPDADLPKKWEISMTEDGSKKKVTFFEQMLRDIHTNDYTQAVYILRDSTALQTKTMTLPNHITSPASNTPVQTMGEDEGQRCFRTGKPVFNIFETRNSQGISQGPLHTVEIFYYAGADAYDLVLSNPWQPPLYKTAKTKDLLSLVTLFNQITGQ